MKNFFHKNKTRIIGMIHFGPLGSAKPAVTVKEILQKAQLDMDTLVTGGVDAIMFENMYDFPHTERLDTTRKKKLSTLVKNLSKSLHLPFGISALWNDYQSALEIARETKASFIRVPVFADSVTTDYGVFLARPEGVLKMRKKMKVESVAILADIQVKHAHLLKKRIIEKSAVATKKLGADACIVTGIWTGEPPALKTVKRVKKAVGHFPLLIGSGMTSANVRKYLPSIDGIIVGTSLKQGKKLPREKYRLRLPWQKPVSLEKVRRLIRAVRGKTLGQKRERGGL